MKMKSKPECLNDFLTVDEAAAQKDCTLQGIRNAIHEKRLPAKRKGRQFLIHKTDFKNFMKSLTV